MGALGDGAPVDGAAVLGVDCSATGRRWRSRLTDERAALAKAMNDMLMQDYVIIPLVYRGRVSAHSNSLGGVKLNTWDSEMWNIADWFRK